MSKKKGIFIRVDDDLKRKLDLLSKKTGKSKSDIIRDALEVYTRDKDLMTYKMIGIIKGVKLEEVEELYHLIKLKW